MNEVAANSFEGFINEIDSKMAYEQEYHEDDFCSCFIDHLDDSMETLVGTSSSFMDTFYDTGMDMAGYQPF